MGFAVTEDTVLIADGGLATELEARGHDLSDALWSARMLVDAPHEITAVHAAFFRAGATIATTASYQASFDAFAARGIGRDQTIRLLRRSVELAVERAHRGSRVVRNAAVDRGVGGSVRRRAGRRLGVPRALRTERRAAGRPGIGLGWRCWPTRAPTCWRCETIPDVDEAEALVNVVRSLGVPAWLSYTIDGMRTRAGQPLADAFAVAAGVPEIVAVGVNCCAPADVLPAIGPASATGKPVIVYPNSGERWDAARRAWVGPAQLFASVGGAWVSAGARIVGGCCRVAARRHRRVGGRADLAAQAFDAESFRYSSTVSMIP